MQHTIERYLNTHPRPAYNFFGAGIRRYDSGDTGFYITIPCRALDECSYYGMLNWVIHFMAWGRRISPTGYVHLYTHEGCFVVDINEHCCDPD